VVSTQIRNMGRLAWCTIFNAFSCQRFALIGTSFDVSGNWREHRMGHFLCWLIIRRNAANENHCGCAARHSLLGRPSRVISENVCPAAMRGLG
jgi:hypothetical protein